MFKFSEEIAKSIEMFVAKEESDKAFDRTTMMGGCMDCSNSCAENCARKCKASKG